MSAQSKPVVRVLAAAAHPDDIEFMMAGTLLLLRQAGAEIHMWNLANGSCGTLRHSKDEIIRLRAQEARDGARVAGAAGEIGTLEPGKLADLLVLERDPLISIGNVGAISQVMKGGRLFSRDALMGPAKERVVLDVGATKDDLK